MRNMYKILVRKPGRPRVGRIMLRKNGSSRNGV
jgi:hypothetical protein